MTTAPITYGPHVKVSSMAHAVMCSLNILYVLGSFSRALQWIQPNTRHLHLKYWERMFNSDFAVTTSSVSLHLETLNKPVVRDTEFHMHMVAVHEGDCWVVYLPSEFDVVNN